MPKYALVGNSAQDYGDSPPAGGDWVVVRKTANETRSANTTITADSALALAMLASTKYLIRGEVWFDTVAAADFKWRHRGPASPTLVRINRGWTIPGGTAFAGILTDQAFSAADLTQVGTGTNGGYIYFSGIVHNGLNAANFEFAWAQNSSDAGNTTVLAGSYLEYKAF